MARFYDEDEWYPGYVVGKTGSGYMIEFEGYEEDGAQETAVEDVELLDPSKTRIEEKEATSSRVDLDTYLSRLAQLKEILGGQVGESDMNSALEMSNFDVEKAVSLLLDWIAHGKPGGELVSPDKARKQASTPTVLKDQELKKSSTPRSEKPTVTPKKGKSGGKMTPSSQKKKNQEFSSVANELDGLGLEEHELGETNAGEVDEEAFDLVPEVESDGRETISLVVVGHVDAGKSTLNGHLLCLLGSVDQRTMHKYEKESKAIGKGSFAFAWVLDGHAEERERGVTIDVGVTHFKTEHRHVQLLDAPGHKDFVPSMISGAAQADAAILVIDGSTGEFESGFHSGGQTVEHAILVRSLGVQQMIVAVNKLDNVDYSKDRYEQIQDELSRFLVKAGFRASDVFFIPCSGFSGENLLQRKDARLTAWYDGPTLIELIDLLRPPPRPVDLPLRLSISDVFKTQAMGSCVAGRIEAGVLSPGAQVLLRPGDLTANVRSVQRHGNKVATAKAGDSVTVALTSIDFDQVQVGAFLCPPEAPIPLSSSFLAQILLFDIQEPVTLGYQATMYLQSTNEPVVVSKMLCTVKKSTGEVSRLAACCV
uniref:Tr-type G domain-containing protein n=2 Tax=Guillardia theta TaxID=55529 RepID=A0A7S4H849_GUITH